MDYIIIAKAIRTARDRMAAFPHAGTPNQLGGARRVAAHIAEELDTDEEKIDFLKLCGYGA